MLNRRTLLTTAGATVALATPLAGMLPGWSDGDVTELTQMLVRLSTTLALDPAAADEVQLSSPITAAPEEASA